MTYKLKTCKSAAKRVKIKRYSFSRKKAFKAHLMSSKSSKRARRLSQSASICLGDISSFRRM